MWSDDLPFKKPRFYEHPITNYIQHKDGDERITWDSLGFAYQYFMANVDELRTILGLREGGQVSAPGADAFPQSLGE